MLKAIRGLISERMEGMAYWDIDGFTLPFFTNMADENGRITCSWLYEIRDDILNTFYFPTFGQRHEPPFYHWIERHLNKETVFPEKFWSAGILTSFNGVIENEDESILFIDEKGNVYFRDEETPYYDEKDIEDFRDEEITFD